MYTGHRTWSRLTDNRHGVEVSSAVLVCRSVLDTASLTRSTDSSREDTSRLATGIITGDCRLHSTGPEKVRFLAKYRNHAELEEVKV